MDPHIWLSRSWTTRPRRPGEPPDAYVFVDRAEFEDAISRGRFLEWAEYLGHLYGTPLPDPPSGHDVLLEIDVQGARQVHSLRPDALLVFVDAPSRDEQRRRLEGRGDDPESIEKRLRQADRELAAARELGMHMVVNDDVERCAREILKLVDQRRSHQGRR
ncbi:MAG: guanylate kinase [Acidimicrobiales bacterium]|nr:MAG: guanylate kinase [Acidimicrobiales bacterium]